MNTSDQPSSSKRISILSATEQHSIYQLPDFTKEEQAIYFSLNIAERDIFKSQLRGLDSKVIFILQLGYFRALFKFFTFTIFDVRKDALFVLEKYFPGKTWSHLSGNCNKKALIHHHHIIKTLYSYKEVDITVMQRLLKKAEGLLLKDSNPKYVFKELHSYLNKNCYIFPGYTTMQDLISRAIQNHERRITSVINCRFTDDLSEKVNRMLSRESEHRYYLTLIKAPPNSFTLIQSTKEREKRDFLNPVFIEGESILKEIGISQQSIKYYARLVDQFTVQRLQQLDIPKRYFYILCFVSYRYLKINDALIKTMLYQITKFNNEVIESVKEQGAFLNIENRHNLKKGSQVLDLLTSDQFSDDEKIRTLRKEAYRILSKNKLNSLSYYLKKANIDIEQLRWQQVDRQGHKIKKNIRHILRDTVFESTSEVKSIPLFAALTYLQKFIQSTKRKMEQAPLGHVPKSTMKYLYRQTSNGKVLDAHRYEVLVYRLLKKKIDSSDIFVPHSIEYRNMESDLIDKAFYLKNKYSLHTEYDNEFLYESLGTRVERKLNELDDLLNLTNQRILSNENSSFKYSDDTRTKWHVEYQGVENKDINNPIFQKLPKIDLPRLIWLADQQTGFLSEFTHVLYKDAKTVPEPSQIIGTIIAYATNMGFSRMAACSNITLMMMKSTRDAFFREHTLRAVNDMIVNATARLPIQELYKIGGTIHSAVDGKKYDAPGHIFNARYSPKYFNLGKGISIMTLMINYLPVSMKLISPNEYEGNFGLELLLMNETNVQSLINSSDMHGINELNFALYDAAGYDFQPRYTNLYDASQNIASSKRFSSRPDHLILPATAIDEKLITDQEDSFKRIMVSVLSKTCAVSTIIKKLTSSPKSHQTRKAIAEYNKILRSIHILKSINYPDYRQNIQKALNRTELYHFLTGEVGYANRGKIIAKTEIDQIIFKECTRLVCNTILYYNSVILSRIYTNFLKNSDDAQITALKSISPCSWININLYGLFELKNYFNTTIPEIKTDDFKESLLKNDYEGFA